MTDVSDISVYEVAFVVGIIIGTVAHHLDYDNALSQ